MKLRVDPACVGATARPAAGELCGGQAAPDREVDLRRLPWADGAFAAIELDDVPAPGEWTVSGPALNECRRVLKRHGLLEIRTRPVAAALAQATEHRDMGALTRLLQNHGFDVISVEIVEENGSMISAMALRGDGPEDAFEDGIAATTAHLTLHGPMLDASEASANNRALAASLDRNGVKVRVRVIFDVLDGLYCE
jgi:hypothetical protein